jgi:hypothetical protein
MGVHTQDVPFALLGSGLGSFENAGLRSRDESADVDVRTTAGLETGATLGVAIFMRGCEMKDHGRLFSYSPYGRKTGLAILHLRGSAVTVGNQEEFARLRGFG